MEKETALSLPLPDALVEVLASRVAAILEERGLEEADGFLDVEGAARLLGISKKSVYGRCERGELPVHRLGGRLLFDPKEIRETVMRR